MKHNEILLFDGSLHAENSETVRTLYQRRIQSPVKCPKYIPKEDTGQQLLITPLQVQLPLL